ncbi:MAG: hypothetical protein WDM85_06065 [Caulobacteraceae bacterium]
MRNDIDVGLVARAPPPAELVQVRHPRSVFPAADQLLLEGELMVQDVGMDQDHHQAVVGGDLGDHRALDFEPVAQLRLFLILDRHRKLVDRREAGAGARERHLVRQMGEAGIGRHRRGPLVAGGLQRLRQLERIGQMAGPERGDADAGKLLQQELRDPSLAEDCAAVLSGRGFDEGSVVGIVLAAVAERKAFEHA